MRSFLLATFGLMLCFVVGCHGVAGLAGGGSANVIGKWTGNATADPGFEKDPAFEMAKGLTKSINFEFKADKTFTGSMIFPIEGTYTVVGNTVTLTITKAMGMETKGKGDNDKPLVLEMASDGKTMTAKDMGADKGPKHYKLTFEKN